MTKKEEKMPDASWGYTAEQGLRGVLGGEDIDKINKREGAMSPEGMRAYILAAPEEEGVSYGDDARRFAKAVLLEAEGDMEGFFKDSHQFGDTVSHKADYDLTGFMFGWAVNAVRYVLGAPPIRNPAIVDLPG